jgi:hypothetical protein
MLVTFSSPAYADITMFGDVAVRLLKLMGHSGTIPGALRPEDVGKALEHLEAGIAASGEPPPEQAAEDEDGEPVISLQKRAFPLLELLRAAQKAKVHVMWEKKS